MTAPDALAILVYSAQIALLVGSGAVGAALFRLPIARVRFAYWWTVIAACAALPLMPQWFAAPAWMITAATDAGAADLASAPRLQPLGSLMPLLLLGGALLRAVWLALGVLALRRLRASSSPATLDSDLQSLVTSIAPGAEFRWHASTRQPVTFGWLRPVVLLPHRLSRLPLEIQRAAVVHEAVHVARRDWLRLLIEQAVQAAFWFHPAMWWAIDQAHLAREQIVDEAAIAVTGARHAYLTALVSFSDGFPTPTLAAPFLRRRHILRRAEAIVARSAASARRIAVCAIGLGMTIAMATVGAASLVSLQRDGRNGTVYTQKDGVTLPTPIKSVRPEYPEAAQAARIEGTVLMECVVTADGQVSEIAVARQLDPMLDAAATAALEQWVFKPGMKDGVPVAVRVQVEMTFTLK